MKAVFKSVPSRFAYNNLNINYFKEHLAILNGHLCLTTIKIENSKIFELREQAVYNNVKHMKIN